MANVKAAMEHDLKLHQKELEERLSKLDFDKPLDTMMLIHGHTATLVMKHEKEIQELKQWVTMQQVPTKICGPNLVGVLNAAGFYQKKEWVGLTDEEIDKWKFVGNESLREFVRAIEAKLKEKNT